ncbi:MAG: hypothetical protein NC412_10065 [Roseburia sp.]|nr:hypothetical protein [Roseburia sp.]MCM1277506.1 hypothetical protein [Robinsoniella sp.]
MDSKVTSIVAYISLVGTIIAIVAGDKEGAKFHLNQALVINIGMIICSIVTVIPFIGGIIGGIGDLLLLVCWIIGLIAAIKQEEKEVPLLGKIKILK